MDITKNTPNCCEAWLAWQRMAAWYALEDDPRVHVMPHLPETPYKFNFCPSCGASRRDCVLIER